MSLSPKMILARRSSHGERHVVGRGKARRSGVLKRLGPCFPILAPLLAHILSSSTVLGQLSFSQAELKSLPRTCQAQRFIHEQIYNPITAEAERQQLQMVLGEDFTHYHHYCWALLIVRRGNTTDQPNRRYGFYDEAVKNFDYVLRNVKPSFLLLPEVYLQKGLTLQLMSNDAAAAREFLNALRVKPSYTPAYAALIDYYLNLGNVSEARRMLEVGLEHAPSSKLLEEKRKAIEATESRSKN